MNKSLSFLLKAIIVIASVWGISLCAFDTNAFMGVMYYVFIMLVFLLLVGRLYIYLHQKIKS